MTFSKKLVAFGRSHNFTLVTLALIALAYAPLISTLGFYWDDWLVILNVHSGRLLNMVEIFAFDRPFSAWTVLLLGPILGASSLAWHIFSLFLRGLLTLAMAWSLNLIWPQQGRAILWASLLFSVYPLYFLQPIAVAFSQHLISYTLYFLSLAFMTIAIRQPERYWRLTMLALMTQLTHLLTVEHFAGLELLRPIFLFIVLKEVGNSRQGLIRDVLRYWSPYLLALVVFSLWRLVWLQLPVEPHALVLVEALKAQPLNAILGLLEDSLQGLVHTLGTSWYRITRPELFDLGDFSQLFSWLTGGLAGIGLYFWGVNMQLDDRKSRSVLVSWIWIGLLAVLLGLLPIWLIGKQIIETGYNEHLALPALFGAAIFWTALIMTLIERKKYQILVIAALIGLAVAGQLRVTNELRNDWKAQQRLYHQLSWRAPDIQANTALVSFDRLTSYMQNSSVSAALNTMYPQNNIFPKLDYWNFELTISDNIATLENGEIFTASNRGQQFVAEDGESNLLYFLPESGCLWVLTPLDAHNQYLPDETRALALQSKTSRIVRDRGEGIYAATEIFGKTNTNTWCYYFQKAELARQFGDWVMVLAHYNKAFNSGLKADNGIEYIGLVDAYAHLEYWELALELSRDVALSHVKNIPMLCALWEQLAVSDDLNSPTDILSRISQFAECQKE